MFLCIDTSLINNNPRGRIIAGAVMLGLLLGLAAPVHATPGNARLYKQAYGIMPACHACHTTGGGSALNTFGNSFKKSGESVAAFKTIASQDADGDGVNNAAEGVGKSNPGDKKSTPSAPGDWLSTIALIPTEVQAQFPGIKEYLPRDAVLTDADIARAKTMGAVLSKADENTIYIPLVDKKPGGTALIFPAKYQGKIFFLMLATDRKLNITKVQAMHTDKVPAAAKSGIYPSFVGVPVDKLQANNGNTLDAAIATAVKNAGTLLYVRLKS